MQYQHGIRTPLRQSAQFNAGMLLVFVEAVASPFCQAVSILASKETLILLWAFIIASFASVRNFTNWRIKTVLRVLTMSCVIVWSLVRSDRKGKFEVSRQLCFPQKSTDIVRSLVDSQSRQIIRPSPSSRSSHASQKYSILEWRVVSLWTYIWSEEHTGMSIFSSLTERVNCRR